VTYAIDPELAEFVATLPVRDWDDPVEARTAMDGLIAMLNAGADTTGVRIEDRLVPGPRGAPEIAVRVYAPADRKAAVPGLLDIHGGGFVMGSIDMEHAGAARFARSLGVVVVAVEYRLAPEHPFPVPVEDTFAVLAWAGTQDGIDTARISVGGISSGGCIAAAVTLLARDRSGPPVLAQALETPVLDLTMSQPSIHRFGRGGVLTPAAIAEGYQLYAPRDADRGTGYASPALAADLSGLPPAFILTAEFDPLRDEGELYARRLRDARVPVTLVRARNHAHSTLHGAGRSFRSARTYRAMTGSVLRAAYASG